jgi:hypothetical protein
MEAGDHGLGNDQTKRLDRTGGRCVLLECQVRAGLVVVNGVPGHDPAKVRLAEHDHMVEALASDRAALGSKHCPMARRRWRET